MIVFVVEQHFTGWNDRVDGYHAAVYHGAGEYPKLKAWEPKTAFDKDGEQMLITRPPDWRWPAVTNENRDLLHITRSGRFVPALFSGSILANTLVLSPEIQKRLSSRKNVVFNDVVFEQLVDLAMPPLGDASWYYTKAAEKYGLDPDEYLRSLPHVPQFEKRVKGYRQLLPANFDDIAKSYSDIKLVTPEFGSYKHVTSIGTGAHLKEHRQIRVSEKMLEKYPIVQNPHWLFREDAFERIAPFLDLDYYAIAVLAFDKPSPHIDAYIKDMNNLFDLHADDSDE